MENSTFCKKCIFTIENPKKLRKFLPRQMPDFAATCAITAATRKILSTTRAILALTKFCHLSMYMKPRGGGALGAPRGDPPIHEKNFNF